MPTHQGASSPTMPVASRFVMLLTLTGTVLLLLLGLRLSESLSTHVHQSRIRVAHNFSYLQEQAHTLTRVMVQSSSVQRGTHFRHAGLLSDYLNSSAQEFEIDLILVHDRKGKLLYRGPADASAGPLLNPDTLKDTLKGKSFSRIEQHGQQLRLVSTSPIYHPTQSNLVTGSLAIAYDLDNDFLKAMQAMSGTPLLLVSNGWVSASSLDEDVPKELKAVPQQWTFGTVSYDLSPIPIQHALGYPIALIIAVDNEESRSTLYWVIVVLPLLFFLFWRERTTTEYQQSMTLKGAVDEVQAQISDAQQAASASRLASETAQSKLVSTQQFLIRAQRLSLIGEQLSSVSHDIFDSMEAVVSVQKGQRTNTTKCLQAMAKLGLGGNESRELEGALRDLETGIYENQLASQRIKSLVSALMQQSVAEHTVTKGNDIESLIAQTLTILRGRTKQHKITTDYLTPPLFEGCVVDIGQVLTNLLSNAIDAVGERAENELRYGRHYEGRIHIHAAIAIRDGISGLRLIITDNGSGISEPDLTEVFKPFFASKPVGSGIGLGLTISQRIIEEHSGILTASNDPALGGARLDMWIPATQQAPEES